MSEVLDSLKLELAQIDAEGGIDNPLNLRAKVLSLINLITKSDNPNDIEELYKFSPEILGFNPGVLVGGEEEETIKRLRDTYNAPEVVEKVSSILNIVDEGKKLSEWQSLGEKQIVFAKKIVIETLEKCEHILRESQAVFDSLRDKLTELPNRRGFDEIITRLYNESSETIGEKPLSVIYVDLDHFKRINDKFGHENGDAILTAVSNVLEEVTSNIKDEEGIKIDGYAARHGGEEFICAIQGADSEKSIRIASEILEKISRLYYRSKKYGYKIDLTASLGVVTYDAGTIYASTGDMIKFADHVTYCVKRDGRTGIMHINHLKQIGHKCETDDIVEGDSVVVDHNWIKYNLKEFIKFLFSNQDPILRVNSYEKKEPIANVSGVDADLKQLACLILFAYDNGIFGDKSPLFPYLDSLKRFISDTKVDLDERFTDVYNIMKGNNPKDDKIREEIKIILKT